MDTYPHLVSQQTEMQHQVEESLTQVAREYIAVMETRWEVFDEASLDDVTRCLAEEYVEQFRNILNQ
jgi:hypothetical protein